ncbi:MAG: ATP-dependent helicase, partial [Thermodesulfobacteriota bacterium]|nr:ATP-dependent helicase [Thermodesulfobacteriota bacterium]
MSVARQILDSFPDLDNSQLEAVGDTEGALLIIAGPGSGKTLVLVVRALNILFQNLASPQEMLICTFTEKAAFELRDRISAAAKKINYPGDLSDILVGTIHSICNDFLMTYRHLTPLGNNYEVLDEFTQLLFLYDNFDEIIGPEVDGKYLNRWTTRWTAIEGTRNYFDKITEELVDPDKLLKAPDPFIRAVGAAYLAYETALWEKNCIDFAHQQKLCYHILQNPRAGEGVKGKIKYIMVDEYQDTNYIQERLLLLLAGPQNNICVVGDEDQSIYRFRGATVRNILEFPKNYADCKIHKLTINYRSHEKIIQAYNKFMMSHDWSNPESDFQFRYPKEITPDPEGKFPEYPAVFSVWGESRSDEGTRVAELIHFLKENRGIEDYSQVALFLHSVRMEHSGHYLQALENKGIPAFCPRARSYFDNEEIRYMVACFAVLLGYYGEQRGEVKGKDLSEMVSY